MIVSSPVFWALIILGAFIYWRIDPRFRERYLVAISAAYIAYQSWTNALFLLVVCTLAFVGTHKLEGRTRWLSILAAVAVSVYLGVFKYLPPIFFAISGGDTKLNALVLPLGASYFTFKLIHYVVESHRKHIPKHTYWEFLSYMFFVPMFSAGPIERFEEYLKSRSPNFSIDLVYRGGTRVVYGLVKKLVIVDLFIGKHVASNPEQLWSAIPIVEKSMPATEIVKYIDHVHPLFVWQFVINHYVAWYLDFSGYCDIAIGLGLLFGVKLMENFEYPFFVTNIGDFWRRYHISLSNWCQRYIYFPMLGWTRNAQVALFASMIAMGLWHNGNFNYLFWGIYQASMLSLYLVWTRYRRRRIGAEPEEGGPFGRLVDSRAFGFAGGVITFLGVCASAAFPSTQDYGLKMAFRVLGRLIGI